MRPIVSYYDLFCIEHIVPNGCHTCVRVLMTAQHKHMQVQEVQRALLHGSICLGCL